MSIQIYSLPNHSWLPSDWYPSGSKCDKPEIVVRRTVQGVLIRNEAWSAAKNGRRYTFSKEFCGENRPNETWKPFDLWMWGDSTIGILAQKATDGNAAAAQELARLAIEATGRLNRILIKKPELLKGLAGHFRAWPVIKHKKARLSEDEKQLFSMIGLGADDFIENDPQAAKWRLDDAGLIAYYLLVYILRARGDIACSLNFGGFRDHAQKYLTKKFCADSASDWWNFAKAVLLYSYPEPHTIDELNQLVSKNSVKRKSPGRLKQAILDKLQARFLSFAQNPY